MMAFQAFPRRLKNHYPVDSAIQPSYNRLQAQYQLKVLWLVTWSIPMDYQPRTHGLISTGLLAYDFDGISAFFSHLEHSRKETSLGGLTVLAKNRKKQHLFNVLQSLRTIKTLVSCFNFYKTRVFVPQNLWYKWTFLCSVDWTFLSSSK